jgi:hypothetical protein
MHRSLLFSFILLLFVTFMFPLLYTNSYQINAANERVVYELPYPGILPDHPLYFVKAARDRGLEITTRDPVKKAELYLLLSDKRFRMGMLLEQKGKEKLAISTFSKGEKYFLKIPDLLIEAKEQGGEPSGELILKLKQSNAKHAEILEEYMKRVSQGGIAGLDQVLKINKEITQQLTGL